MEIDSNFGVIADRYADRWQILQDVAVIWSQFPLFGTGLGTHEVVYPMFESATLNTLASHAENEYAQVLEETGIAGLILLALDLVLNYTLLRKLP